MGKINYPESETDSFFGGIRHIFRFENRTAWIVEPTVPAEGLPWSWCLEWPGAFVPRTPVPTLLKHGYHHVYVDVLPMYANAEALGVLFRFSEYLRGLGLAPKAALVGLSMGGLYSFRFAENYPDRVSCIYADAPVCDLDYGQDAKTVMADYGLDSPEQLRNHPLSPVNAMQNMAKAKIPVLIVAGEDDLVVRLKDNGALFAERYHALGAPVELIRRPLWGHHPHGFDDPTAVVDFLERNVNEALACREL